MILTVIEHMASVPLDRFAGWLAEGPTPLEVVVVRPWAGEPVPTVDECGDGLLVLGGQQCAYDDVNSPWLPATRTLLAEATRAGLPTLGICLGAQLLAVANGGAVQVAAPPGIEAGIIDVVPRPAAVQDRLLGALAVDVPADHPLGGGILARMPSMHADAVVSLPSGAVWLASSTQYPYQAFRVGEAAWGVQFHPEVTDETLLEWADEEDAVDTDAVRAQIAAHGAEVEHAGRVIAQTFAAIVAEVAARREPAALAG